MAYVSCIPYSLWPYGLCVPFLQQCLALWLMCTVYKYCIPENVHIGPMAYIFCIPDNVHIGPMTYTHFTYKFCLLNMHSHVFLKYAQHSQWYFYASV